MELLRLDARHDGLPHLLGHRVFGQWLAQAHQVSVPAAEFSAQSRIFQQQVFEASARQGRHQADGVIGCERTAQARRLIIHASRHLRRRSMPRRIQDLTEPSGACN